MPQYRKPILSIESIATKTYLSGDVFPRPLSSPIIRSSTFAAKSSDELARNYMTKEVSGEFYQRFGHTSDLDLGKKMAALEGAEVATTFATGMAAISTSLLAHLPVGSHIVASEQIFEQTSAVLKWLSDERNVSVTFVDTRIVGDVASAVQPNTQVIYVETPSNPALWISDIGGIGEVAKSCGALLFVDSTFATPLVQQPISLGASLVLHSATKLISGHMDVMCGLAIGDRSVLEPIVGLKQLLGGIMDPQASWLIERSLRTLPVRAEKAFSTAHELAEYLDGTSRVKEVRYPMLKSYEGYEIASKQMSAGGSVVSFTLHGGSKSAKEFIDNLQIVQIASSLGGVETTIEIPNDLDWNDDAPAKDLIAIIDPGLIRLSVGLENSAELKADIDRALSLISSAL